MYHEEYGLIQSDDQQNDTSSGMLLNGLVDTSYAADEEGSVDLGGRRIIKKAVAVVIIIVIIVIVVATSPKSGGKGSKKLKGSNPSKGKKEAKKENIFTKLINMIKGLFSRGKKDKKDKKKKVKNNGHQYQGWNDDSYYGSQGDSADDENSAGNYEPGDEDEDEDEDEEDEGEEEGEDENEDEEEFDE